ncbi:MAG TPA: hypothetical protein VL123_00195 [Candidatus Udaeobacter sp.]|nr:hypothetical protein [Candidatus Udaeobacter sp.]
MTQPTNLNPLARQATTREFLAVVFRRKWLVIGLFAVATVTVAVIALSTPVVYVSTGRIMVKRGEQSSMLNPYRQVVNDWEADLASEVEVAKSYPVLQRARAILREESKNRPMVILNAKQVDVEVMGKSTVVGIAYEDRDPEVAQRACDALMRAYVDYRQNTLTLSYPKGFFETEIATVQKDLAQWMERRRRFTSDRHLVNVADQAHVQFDVIGQLEKRRNDLASDLAQTRSTVEMMKRLQDRPDIELPNLSATGTTGDALMEVKRKVVEQEARVAQIRERYRDDSPEVTNALETLKTLRDIMQRGVADRVEVSEARIHSLEAGLAVVDHDIAERRAALQSMPDDEVALAQMDREISVLQTRYENLSRDADQARVTQNTSPTVSVVLLSPAGPAVSKTSRDYVRLALAPAFSLVVGIGLAFFIDGLDVTVRTSGQAEEAIDLPVLATLNERRRAR